MLILSVSIFNIFLNLKIKDNKIINSLASTTLGVYMLHHGILLGYIWKTIFKSKEHMLGPHPIISIFSSTLIIFIIGALIDLIRQLLEKLTVNKLLNIKFVQKIGDFLKLIISKIEALM